MQIQEGERGSPSAREPGWDLAGAETKHTTTLNMFLLSPRPALPRLTIEDKLFLKGRREEGGGRRGLLQIVNNDSHCCLSVSELRCDYHVSSHQARPGY